MMKLEYKQKLEAAGYQVIEKESLDSHFRTKTFIRKPDGTLSAFYDYLWQIPMQLNEGDEVSTYDTEVPPPARNSSSHEIHAQTFGYDGIIGTLLVLIFIGIIMGVLFMKAFFHDEYSPPPCGERGSIIEITECVKEIIYPDCSGVLLDSCTGEILDEFDPPVPPPPDIGIIEWVIIGAAAIGGVYIAVKVLPGYLKKKK